MAEIMAEIEELEKQAEMEKVARTPLGNLDTIFIEMDDPLTMHNPPHVHVWYSGAEFRIGIRTGEPTKGSLDPAPPQKRRIRKWLRYYQEELLNMWDARNPRPLPPTFF